MNCKQGDMAVVISGTKGRNIGKVVTCIRLLARHEHKFQDKWGPVWLVDRDQYVTSLSTGSILRPQAPDMCLMPINPKDDESTERAETLLVE